MSASDEHGLLQVPLFPLPNVVLFPRAVLPLHIFEERYKAMTSDALAGANRIAMALLKPGWEKDYYSNPQIEPVVCVGQILASEKLDDGKYNFLLQGIQRAVIVDEIQKHPYRIARLRPLIDSSVLEIDLTNERRRLIELFSQPYWQRLTIGRKFHNMLTGSIQTDHVADLGAFNFLEDVQLKQSLLADTDVSRRVVRIISALEQLAPALEATLAVKSSTPSLN